MEQPRRGHLARQVTPTHSGAGWELYTGDCADVMAGLQAESVDSIVTSPPYAMQRKSTYGGIPEAEYPAWTVRWMNEARRVLKPDGSVIINIAPHIKNGQISDYTLRTRLALREDGWNEAAELIWFKRSAPPTGSPSRPRRSWESLHWFSKHGRPYGNPKANGEKMSAATLAAPSQIIESGRAARNGWSHGYAGGGSFGNIARCRDVVEMNIGHPDKWSQENAKHPAPFPWKLAEWCGKLITPPGGTILDPFNGSASTGVAALRNGWNYIGIDAVPEYIEMSSKHLDHEAGKEAA